MTFSRDNPSPRYQKLVELHQSLHEQGEPFMHIAPEKTFTGDNIVKNAKRVKWLVQKTGAQTILDYGAGKGLHWDRPCNDAEGHHYSTLKGYVGVSNVRCYDPAYAPFREFPAGQRFDGVVSMDVLEHCPEEDIPWILDELFSFAKSFVIASIDCYPAIKHLPNGENAHATVRPVEWWENLIEGIAKKHPLLLWEFWFKYRTGEQNSWEQAVFSNAEL